MAKISSKADIGKNVQIAETAIIEDNVSIGDNSIIGHYCIIGARAKSDFSGRRLTIGASSNIRSHTIIYEGSTFGPRLMVGHSCMIREGITAGTNLQVGSMNDLEGDATIGDWVRFHSNVHICRGTTIGDLVWVFPFVVTTNDPAPPSGLKLGPTLEHGSAVCTQSVVLPETRVGLGALVGAMTRAAGAIPASGLFVGNPGKLIGSVRKIRYVPHGYQHPWMNHHSWYYPIEAHARIKEIENLANLACEELEARLRK